MLNPERWLSWRAFLIVEGLASLFVACCLLSCVVDVDVGCFGVDVCRVDNSRELLKLG
jgi:hypothetical protein